MLKVPDIVLYENKDVYLHWMAESSIVFLVFYCILYHCSVI